MYSHSVMKNDNTLNHRLDHDPTIDVNMVVGGSYRDCLLNHDSYYYLSHIPEDDRTVEVGCFYYQYEDYGWYGGGNS